MIRLGWCWLLLWTGAFAQPISPLNCSVTSVPALVRAEGLSEPLGDIVWNCGGGIPAAQVSVDLHAFLSVPVANKLSGTDTLDAVLTVDTGSGPQPAGATPVWLGPGTLVFRGMRFLLPSSGTAVLRMSNLRGAVAASPAAPIRVQFAANGPSAIRIDNSPAVVGTALTGLLAGYSSTFICRSSPLPSTVTFLNLIAAGTRYASARFTEGFASSFQRKGALDDNGTRILVRYSGFPKESRVFVPDVIAGSTALEQTAGADLGLPVSGGRYQAGSTGGALLLIRIRGHDANGAGGALFVPPPHPALGPVAFDGASEVDLTAGSGLAVYEVVDSNPTIRESAQFPTFLGLPPQELPVASAATVRLSFGPALQAEAPLGGPVPRFLALSPPPDCDVLRDCGTNFPKMRVDSERLVFIGLVGSGHQTRHVFIYNDGGGILEWIATVTYKNGTGWVRLDPPSGRGGMRVDVLPLGLAAGLYEATLTIEAGPIAGTKSLPITLRVESPPPPVIPPTPVIPPPQVDSVVNAASLAAGPIAPGSLAVIRGSRFSGQAVEVSMERLAVRVISRSETQLQVEVPSTLAARQTAQLVVTVDGRPSLAVGVPIVAVAPAVFSGAVFNQDNSTNDETHPAEPGSILQIFATGLPVPGSITAKIHDREIEAPDYAGPAPGSAGVQQVNLRIPSDLPSMMTELLVCGAALSAPSGQVCSPPAQVWLKAAN